MNVITCFVCYIKTVFRLAYRTFFFTVCYSGLSVRLIKIKLLLLNTLILSTICHILCYAMFNCASLSKTTFIFILVLVLQGNAATKLRKFF